MAKLRNPFKTDRDLMHAALQRAASLDGQRKQIAYHAECLKLIAVVLPGCTVSDHWAKRAYALRGKRRDSGAWGNARMVWIFEADRIDRVRTLLPGLTVERVDTPPPVTTSSRRRRRSTSAAAKSAPPPHTAGFEAGSSTTSV